MLPPLHQIYLPWLQQLIPFPGSDSLKHAPNGIVAKKGEFIYTLQVVFFFLYTARLIFVFALASEYP